MDNRSTISGGMLQLDPHPPPEMRLALCIHHFDPLLSNPAGLRMATLVERFHKLACEPPMCAGDEERLPLVDGTKKVSRTEIAVFNPEITRLHRLQKRSEQRAFLRMAIFTGQDIGHQALRGLIDDQGFAR